METFMKVYSEELHRCVVEFPKLYYYGPSKVPEVISLMRNAIQRGSYSKDGPALKATCQKLKIRYTKESIAHFIANNA